jgi:hypothetical protein
MGSRDVTRKQKPPPVLRLPDGRQVVTRPGTELKVSGKRRQLDIAFVFDTTGSMSDKIDGLIGCMDTLVAEVGRLSLDWRMTTVPFGDLTVQGDEVVATEPFVMSVAEASRQLRSMPRFSGGGNFGESSVEAMLAACRKQYRPNTVKALILLTDEPALGHVQGSAAIHSALYELDAVCFTVAPDGLQYYKDWATAHGGEWRPVGAAVDTSTILALFRSLIVRMVEVVDSVHRLGGGSVRAYLGAADKDRR